MEGNPTSLATANTMTPTKSLKHYSCALCHRRKVKCDRKDPCTYCVTHRVPCVPTTLAAPRPRKRRFPEAELLARLRRYEAALKSYGADIESIKNSEDQPAMKSSPQAGNSIASSSTDLAFTPPVKMEPKDHVAWPSAEDEVSIVSRSVGKATHARLGLADSSYSSEKHDKCLKILLTTIQLRVLLSPP